MIYLISPKKKQYKANLHSHSTLSDGKKTPEELKELYRKNGYSILAITDHERPRSHTDLNEKDFILLTGYEAHIRPNDTGAFDAFHEEIHINLFAKDAESEIYVGYDENYCRAPKESDECRALIKVGPTEKRALSADYVNAFIAAARENGYLVSYNHPFWSMQDEADIFEYNGFFSLEIMNYGALLINGLDYAGALYDKMLRRGRRIFCHGGDDNHNKYPLDDPESDSLGAYTVIMPDEFSYDGIIAAMERGDMYASMGPELYEVSLDGDKLHIECSDVKDIYVFTGSKMTQRIHAKAGESLTGADFTIAPEAKYIRVSVHDERGKKADTRGFFPEEFR